MRYVRVGADDAGMRLDNYLLRVFKNVPRSRVYRTIRSGEVRINRRRARAGTRLCRHDEIRLPPVARRERAGPGRPPDALVERVAAALVEQRDDYLLFDKPAGLAVHAGSGLRFGLIEVLRAARPGEYLELVHRLDRQTSGCLLVARSRAALDRLRAALGAAGTTKRYLALVHGAWPAGVGEVNAPLVREIQRGGERVVAVDCLRGRASASVFEPLAYYQSATLMEVVINTGRTHQIRVHAAHTGHPVAADGKYGGRRANAYWRERGLRRMFLHARAIDLDYAGARVALGAPLAADLQTVLAALEPWEAG